MKTICLLSGRLMPVLGMGTAGLGEAIAQRDNEIAALRRGIDLGMTLIDTAEIYGEGRAETLIGEAIANCRSSVFLVSKVAPRNAIGQGAIAACENSLQRLQTDYLDLYLLHWRGPVTLSETLAAFETLKQSGKIRDYGVGNFDVEDMEEASALPGGEAIATNQIPYNLQHRNSEWKLLSWCQQRGIPIAAHSPLLQGELLKHPKLQSIAQQRGVTVAQVAIAWLLHQEAIVFPKASSIAHVEQNRAALDLQLTKEELSVLDVAFPPPSAPIALLENW
ncbi:aldo/keto reductase [Nostoc sp. 'Peltigera membranacea cyanobiont' 213]|uniref:aldo/keto reductase n=1 Tax=Nostoc cyanobionts TaxID=3123326 RepID=UPI000B951790|nr:MULTISPECIES: aldo/keto reductase [unclassified Nostoc]AVH65383.1 aldo/keto reductase [Nostoc sp. 'Peltigera membranacea cyanobiont' N6]OYD97147.1 aldo/keto reductase [Nostoc sp. 'Peltigera membranacea cyanobiont' 213]